MHTHPFGSHDCFFYQYIGIGGSVCPTSNDFTALFKSARPCCCHKYVPFPQLANQGIVFNFWFLCLSGQGHVAATSMQRFLN